MAEVSHDEYIHLTSEKYLKNFLAHRSEKTNQTPISRMQCIPISFPFSLSLRDGVPIFFFTEFHIQWLDPTYQISPCLSRIEKFGVLLFWWMSGHIGLPFTPLPRVGKETNLTSVLDVLIWIHCRKLIGERGTMMLSVVWYFHLPAI